MLLLERDRPVVVTEKEKLQHGEKTWLAVANHTMNSLGYVPHVINEICGTVKACRNWIWLHADDPLHRRLLHRVVHPMLAAANARVEPLLPACLNGSIS